MQLQVHEKHVPPFDNSLTFPVWLAYASSFYFQKQGELVPAILQMGLGSSFADSRFPITKVIPKYITIAGCDITDELELLNTGKFRPH